MTLQKIKAIIVFASIGVFVSLSLSFVLAFNLFYKNGKMEVVFLDVGQGDSILIKMPQGQRVLIDGGADNKVLDRIGRNTSFFDRGFDLVIATHPDADHIAGIVPVLKRYPVGIFMDSGVLHTSAIFKALWQTIEENSILVQYIDSPVRYEFGSDVSMDVLYPNKSFVGLDIEDNNLASIVIILRHGSIDFFLGGDAPTSIEDSLVEIYGDLLDVEVLKLGHHGSKTSTSDIFLDATNPEVAVISVGKNNKYGHPDARVLSRLLKRDILILRTDQLGDIRFVSDGESVYLK